jgi:cytochrome c553
MVFAALPNAALGDDLERGEFLFELCQQCHGADGGGMALALAPAIAGQQQWYLEAQLQAFRGGDRGLHPDDLGGLRMYPMSQLLTTDEDSRAVAAYVASLPAVRLPVTLHSGDPKKGEVFWATCKTCHGEKGEGLQPMHTPALVGQHDWYLLTSIGKFKAGVRGSNPKNANAVLMRGMAATLPDENAVHDVIAYIATLKR